MDLTGEQQLGQLITDGLLHQAAQRPGTVDRVEPTLGQPLFGRQRHLQIQAPRSQPLLQLSQLDVDDLHQLVGLETLEDQHVIEPVDELRLERRPHRRHHLLLIATRTEVRGQDEDGVAEVDRAALTVGEPTLVEHGQQYIEHVRVGLLDLVEQHHGVGPTAHRLGELTALVVADVAGRGTDKPCDGMLFAVLAHVDPDHRAFIIE